MPFAAPTTARTAVMATAPMSPRGKLHMRAPFRSMTPRASSAGHAGCSQAARPGLHAACSSLEASFFPRAEVLCYPCDEQRHGVPRSRTTFEVSSGGEQISLGGAKQRAVLAVLLLRAGEVVPVERLIDEVWGTDPPPSAAHTLESYVSRLRQLFNGHGPRLVRRGAGYALELGEAMLDARGFVELQERASLAGAMDEHADVVELTAAALAMWRGPALADVALASAGRAEADRLEELRLRTHELRFDAELALGRNEQAIGGASRSSSPRTRIASASSPTSCSRSIAAGGTRRRSRSTSRRGAGSTTTSGCSRAPTCNSSPGRSCARTASSGVRARNPPIPRSASRSVAARDAWPSSCSSARW